MFSVLQKNIFDQLSCVTHQKTARPVATHSKKPRDDIIKIATVEIYNRSMVQKLLSNEPTCERFHELYLPQWSRSHQIPQH